MDTLSCFKSMVEFAGISIAPEQIVDFLRQEVQLKATCQQIMYQQIVATSAQEHNLNVSAEEIQAAANQVRYQQRLERAADTLNWLSENLMTVEDWEAGLRDRLLTQKLKETLFVSEVERLFAQSRLDYEQVDLYRLRVPYQSLSQELFYQIEEGEISFYEAAHLYDVDEQRRLRCGYEGRLHRWQFDPDTAAAIFGTIPGQILEPRAVREGFDLLMVSEFIPAALTDEIRNSILNSLFEEWLASEFNYFIHNRSN